MGIIKNIKDSIGRYLLRNSSPRKAQLARSLPNYDEVHDIGIVYDANSKEQEEEVNLIVQLLHKEGKKVITMGYVDTKELPPQKKFHITTEYFWREKITRFNLPDRNKIGGFLNTEFDLLMNLFYSNELPLLGMAAYSKSKFSMAANSSLAYPFNNVLIDTGNNKSLHNLALQMIHYLKVVNPS